MPTHIETNSAVNYTKVNPEVLQWSSLNYTTFMFMFRIKMLLNFSDKLVRRCYEHTALQSLEIYQKGRSCKVLQEFLGEGLDCRLSSCHLWGKAEQLSLFRNLANLGCSMMHHSLSLSHVGSDMWGAGWEHSQRQIPTTSDPNLA